jgi:hypothetical protein
MSFQHIVVPAQKLARLLGLRYANIKEAIMVNKAMSRKSSSPTRKRASSPAKVAMPTHDAIARRAFELFLAREGMPGDDVGDWLRAERELSGS